MLTSLRQDAWWKEILSQIEINETMKKIIIILFVFACYKLTAQNTNSSPFDVRYWNVVLQYPEMKNVKVKNDITYFKNDKTELHFDVYYPPKIKKGEKLPAVVFLNVASLTPGQSPVKQNAGNISWATLIASQGIIGITIEVSNTVEVSFDSLFNFLKNEGSKYNIDAQRIGVWAASANTIIVGNYLMKENLYTGIKAAVLYYGFFPTVHVNKKLPVLFVVAEGDVDRNQYDPIWSEILKTKAPWTIKMATNLPHAFEAFSDNDQSRTVIKETISFWRNYLEPVEQPTFKKQIEREVMANIFWHDDKKVAAQMKDWFQSNAASKDIQAYSVYSRALLNSGDYAEAEKVYKKRLAIDPSNQSTHLDLAVAAYAGDKPDAAETYLSDYSKQTPLQRANYIYIANTLRQLRKFKYSVQYYEKALAMEVRPFTHYLIGLCYGQLNEIDKAFEALNKAAELGYNNKSNFETDTDLSTLKQDARWNELLTKLK